MTLDTYIYNYTTKIIIYCLYPIFMDTVNNRTQKYIQIFELLETLA